MIRVWLDMPSDAPDAALALRLARESSAFVLVGASTAGDAVHAVADAMLAQTEPFSVVTTGPLTDLARLITDCPEVPSRWERVVCSAGQLEIPAEANISADRGAAEEVLKRLAPRLVGTEASRNTPAAEGRAFAPLALLSLLRPEAFDFQTVRVLVENDGRLRLTDDGYAVEYALSADWEALVSEMWGLGELR